MLLLQTTFENIKNFGIVVVSIILPVLLLAFGVITFLHYRRKKKPETDELPDSVAVSAQKPLRSSKGGKDYSVVIEQLEYRHQQLKTEFELLEEKYLSVISGNGQTDNPIHQSVLENKIEGYEATINVLKQEKAEIYKALKEAESVKEKKTNEGADMIRLLETKVKELENNLNQQRTQNTEVLSLLEAAEQQNKHLQEASAAALNQQAQTANNDEVLRLSRQLEEVQKQKKMLEEHQQAKEQEINAYNEQVKELNNHITLLKNDVSAKIQILQTTVQEKEQVSEQLKNNEANLHHAEVVQQQLAEEQQKNAQLQQQLDVLQQQLKETGESALSQSYLNDLLEEKKQEISFLQAQLEQRIKNYHVMENQYNAEIEKSKQVNGEVARLNQTVNELRSLVDEKEENIRLRSDESSRMQEVNLLQIDTLQNKVNDLNRQNANLSALIEQETAFAKNVRNHLEEQKLKTATLEQTLKEYITLFEKISSEIAKSNGTSILQMAEERG